MLVIKFDGLSGPEFLGSNPDSPCVNSPRTARKFTGAADAACVINEFASYARSGLIPEIYRYDPDAETLEKLEGTTQ